MTSIRRYFEPNAAYFVTTVTKDRRPIFCNAHYCRIMLVTIQYYKVVFDFRVLGYCLMPDHVHLIIRPSARFGLSYVMQMIKGSFVNKFNKLESRRGHVWQKRYYDEMIRDDRQLTIQLEYVHQNPVKAGLVSSADEYLFSSYRQYHGFSHSFDFVPTIDKFSA